MPLSAIVERTIVSIDETSITVSLYRRVSSVMYEK